MSCRILMRRIKNYVHDMGILTLKLSMEIFQLHVEIDTCSTKSDTKLWFQGGT